MHSMILAHRDGSVTTLGATGHLQSLLQCGILPMCHGLSLTEETVETWTFSWYEDLFAQDAGTKSVVNVASKVYRRIALYEPGEYTVTLNYYDGEQTEAKWLVRPLAEEKRAKNVIFFIGEYPVRNDVDSC